MMYNNRVIPVVATIANGASLSGAINLNNAINDVGLRLSGIEMPAAWTAASLTFQVSSDGVTYRNLYCSGAEYTINAAGGATASGAITLDPAVFYCWPYVKVRSGVAATPVEQGAARTLGLVLRSV